MSEVVGAGEVDVDVLELSPHSNFRKVIPLNV